MYDLLPVSIYIIVTLIFGAFILSGFFGVIINNVETIIKEKEDKLEKKEPVLDQIIKSSLGRTNLHFGIQDKNRGNFLLNKILQQVIMDKSGKDLIRKIRQYRDLYILMVAILLKNNEHFRDSLASQLARRSYMYNN